MSVFVNFDEEEIDAIPIVEEETDEIIGSEDILFTKIDELDFSARSLNCLEKANIKYLGDLIQLNEEDLLNLENFGKRSLNEVRDVISSYNLRLGEDINKDLDWFFDSWLHTTRRLDYEISFFNKFENIIISFTVAVRVTGG